MALLDRAVARDSFQISLHDLTVDEAETSIAGLWLILSVHSIPTPLLRLEPASEGRITLNIFLEHAADTAVACRALCDLRREGLGGLVLSSSASTSDTIPLIGK
jgi:hypothetical protein